MSVTGRIHSFESFGTVYGPNIRFIIFPGLLRCLYCRNRNTWNTYGGREITVEEIMYEVNTSAPFHERGRRRYRVWRRSDFEGGVCARLVPCLLSDGINTSLDINGFVRRYDLVIDELLEVTDLVMLDIKKMNDNIHGRSIQLPHSGFRSPSSQDQQAHLAALCGST
ncbi:MAG: Pyruvate formate-lyase 1-activating enzyme [Sodalis sp.]|nr:MAG: Pyruvate formate-lyase 1-activating enzyme [Sodalis sp.]